MGYSGLIPRPSGYSDETGGRLIDVATTSKKLEAAFQQIEDELRTQYVASYTPTNLKLDGTFQANRASMPGRLAEGAGAQGLLRRGAAERLLTLTRRKSRNEPVSYAVCPPARVEKA